MSQRLGMADGRCFTMNSSSQLYDNYVMEKNGIAKADNYAYRRLLQEKGTKILKPTQEIQGVSKSNVCDNALLNMSDIY